MRGFAKRLGEQIRRAAAEAEHRDDVNIVAAVNVAEPNTDTRARATQHVDIVQNGKRTTITRRSEQ